MAHTHVQVDVPGGEDLLQVLMGECRLFQALGNAEGVDQQGAAGVQAESLEVELADEVGEGPLVIGTDGEEFVELDEAEAVHARPFPGAQADLGQQAVFGLGRPIGQIVVHPLDEIFRSLARGERHHGFGIFRGVLQEPQGGQLA